MKVSRERIEAHNALDREAGETALDLALEYDVSIAAVYFVQAVAIVLASCAYVACRIVVFIRWINVSRRQPLRVIREEL